MRTRLGFLVLTVALFAAPALRAQAQPTEGVRFGLGGGLLVPLGTYGTSDKIGANILGMVQMPIANSPIHLRLAGMYGTTSHEVGSGSTQILGGTADLLYHVGVRSAPVRPYVVGGLGFFNVKNGASQSKLGLGLGGGLLFGIGNMHAFLEARYMSIQTSGPNMRFVPITLGLMFRS